MNSNNSINRTNNINSINDMKVLTIASQKGGCGKSTLAIHIAVMAEQQGLEVIVADLDPNSQTSAEWASERTSQTPIVVRAHTDDIKDLKNQAQDEGFHLLILDCPPYIDKVVMNATKIADYTLIPSQPRFADLRTLPRVIENVDPPYSVILNACTPGLSGQESSKTREARLILKQENIPTSNISIVRREAYSDALNGGEAVIEFQSQGKAAKEISNLWSWLQEELI